MKESCYLLICNSTDHVMKTFEKAFVDNRPELEVMVCDRFMKIFKHKQGYKKKKQKGIASFHIIIILLCGLTQ